MKQVFVTGIGIVSSLGIGRVATFKQLAAEESGIAKTTLFGKEIFVGQVPLTNKELQRQLAIPQEEVVSRTALLGLLAAKEAWGSNREGGLRTAFINSSTVGGMDLSEQYFSSENKEANANLFLMHDLGTITNYIARSVGDFGYVSTISTACSSAANAIMHGGQLIENGHFDRVLVGGADALSNFTIQGFQSLMVYSDKWCMPFDENRTGLNLGEGAAYLVLESEESMTASGNVPLAVLSGWANANDAYHSTGTSPEGFGAQKSMQAALHKAGLAISEIDYINAHGTATGNNDSSELAAMQAVFGHNLPLYSSTKAFTGHTLAPAGALEAVFSILALQNNLVFANINCATPIDASGSLVLQTAVHETKTVLSNSFGFGGNCTSLIFKQAV